MSDDMTKYANLYKYKSRTKAQISFGVRRDRSLNG